MSAFAIGPGPTFSGAGWRVLVADGDPLDQLPDPSGEQLVVLDVRVCAADIARSVRAGRDVLVVLPPSAIDRAVALAADLARSEVYRTPMEA